MAGLALIFLNACQTEHTPILSQQSTVPQNPDASSEQTSVPAAPSVSAIEPDVFLGRNRDQLSSLLGNPRKIRRDPGLEVWQYDARTCMMEFYFYEQNHAYALVYLEARDYSATLIAAEDCLKSLPQHQKS